MSSGLCSLYNPTLAPSSKQRKNCQQKLLPYIPVFQYLNCAIDDMTADNLIKAVTHHDVVTMGRKQLHCIKCTTKLYLDIIITS